MGMPWKPACPARLPKSYGGQVGRGWSACNLPSPVIMQFAPTATAKLAAVLQMARRASSSCSHKIVRHNNIGKYLAATVATRI